MLSIDRSIDDPLSLMQDVAWDSSESKIGFNRCRRAKRPGSPDTLDGVQPVLMP